MLVCNQQWAEPENKCFWTMWTGYDSPSSVACRRPACLESLRSSLLKCYVQEMLRAWIFIKLSFRSHVLLRVWVLTLVFSMFLRAFLPENVMWNDLHDLVSGWREQDLVYFAPLYNEDLQRETIWWNRTLDIKCHTKNTETGQFLHMQVLMPSATHLRLFPSRWDHLLWRNKQTNK